MGNKFVAFLWFSILCYDFYKRHCGPSDLMGWILFWRIVSFAMNFMLLLKGGQAVTTKLECQVAMLVARQVWIHFITVFALMEKELIKVIRMFNNFFCLLSIVS